MRKNKPSSKIIRFSKILTLLLVVSISFYGLQEASADDVDTQVVVGNSAPAFDVDAAESVASFGATPTNAGDTITFIATATDSNAEDYYLAICQTNAVTPTNGGAPTCDGGAWAVSTATTSGTQASTDYVTLTADVESNDWFAFVCDGNAGAAACSASSQGSGDSGSPFKVNHRPAFTAIANDGPINPGATVTYTATSSDADVDTVADTVTLVVCRTQGLSGVACDGGGSDTWCTSTASASDPSCSFDPSVSGVYPDGVYDAYVYVFDNHNFVASGGSHDTNETYTVNNVNPTVSAVTIENTTDAIPGADIVLTESSTTSYTIRGTVTDNNSCTDVSTVEASLYRSGIGYATACDDSGDNNNNNCYAQITCTIDTGANDCTDNTDATAAYECTVLVQYHADPTDINTQFPAENWLTTINSIDDDAATGNTEISSGVELLSLVAYDVTASIDYGSLAVGDQTDPLSNTITTQATGNVGLDQELSGTDLTSGGDSIVVTSQRYSLAAATAFTSGTQLTGTAVETELNVAKTTVTATPEEADTFFGIEIPTGTVAGTYTGTNTVVAVKGEIVNW